MTLTKFLLARRRRAPEPTYMVQLHRLVRAADSANRWAIANSWNPIEVKGLAAARSTAVDLRNQNRWGNGEMFPHVTITHPDGTVEEGL